ncbi:hypothetical protein Cadr_000024200 [Camelus dromedarius]|uniref:Uncharacterized protein n=1 Tax=Camelus dromedarius TaxID=9838 RepID=A0A5N4CWI0_CAMDR|nr:hypothetical protein Cadr_000024200 [Camelus dromedarius]
MLPPGRKHSDYSEVQLQESLPFEKIFMVPFFNAEVNMSLVGPSGKEHLWVEGVNEDQLQLVLHRSHLELSSTGGVESRISAVISERMYGDMNVSFHLLNCQASFQRENTQDEQVL